MAVDHISDTLFLTWIISFIPWNHPGRCTCDTERKLSFKEGARISTPGSSATGIQSSHDPVISGVDLLVLHWIVPLHGDTSAPPPSGSPPRSPLPSDRTLDSFFQQATPTPGGQGATDSRKPCALTLEGLWTLLGWPSPPNNAPN